MSAFVVGKMYRVPCMFVERVVRSSWIPTDGWVPVVGPRHNDVEHLNFDHEHYHVDWRFISSQAFAFATWRLGVPHGRVKDDGTVICPAHGLRWCTKTGALLPHHTEALA